MSGSNANAANVFTYHYAKAAEKTYTNKTVKVKYIENTKN